MKKLVLLILVLCTFTSCAKKNEEFEIRNGIKFGMSKEEVIAIEGEPEFDYVGTEGRYDTLHYLEEYINDVRARPTFLFKGSKLVQIQYSSPTTEKTELNENYEKIEKILNDKYGECLIREIGGPEYVDTFLEDEYREIWYVCSNKDELIKITHSKLDTVYPYQHHVIIEYDGSSYKEAVKYEKGRSNKL